MTAIHPGNLIEFKRDVSFQLGTLKFRKGERRIVTKVLYDYGCFEHDSVDQTIDDVWPMNFDEIGNLVDVVKEEDKNTTVAKKFDSGKPRISLIPKEAIWGMARGLTYGEKKYGTHNFRNGLAYTRLADAALRHLTVWLEGEETDKESGNSHLDHALASLAMLKFMSEHRKDMDDRWLDPVNCDENGDLKK